MRNPPPIEHISDFGGQDSLTKIEEDFFRRELP